MTNDVHFAELHWRGRPLRLEYQWVGAEAPAAPTLVFLHEGLGSLAMWKDFPSLLCDRLGVRGLVFSRYGYGRSTPKPADERWPVTFMHAQAHEVLPLLFGHLNIHRPWLFGHSDGGSIALLHAARFDVAGLVVVAPHLFVEDVSITSIRQAREAYETTDLKQRLARYHDDPDSAFRGWNDVWLARAFRAWNIEADLATITAPVLAVQGADDEYGTLAQIEAIAHALPKTRLQVIPECGHSPHRDQPERLMRHVADFIVAARTPQSPPPESFEQEPRMRTPTSFNAISAGLALTAALGAAFSAHAQGSGPIKVGLMLPATGTFAALGAAIENGFKLYVQEQGGKLAGRDIQYFKVDDESDPSKGTDNVNKLIKRDNVDVIVGTVHSGVALAMAKAAKDSNTLLIVPNAGAGDITGPMCGPNIIRSSFSNWQPGYATGVIAAQKGHKRAMTITWNYAAGNETVKGFTEAFEKGGGKVMKDLNLPFPGVEFQALLTEIAAQKPDVVFAFFAGGGAVKFVKDYAAAGLTKTVPLMGSGFLTDGTLEAQGAAAQGLTTALHYADNLDTPRNNAFRKSYALTYKANADVYAVQGYDAAQIFAAGLNAVKGDLAKRDALTAAMRKVTVDSPRGKFTISPSGNPVQDMFIREAKGKDNEYRGVAVKALADPGRGCKL